MHALNLRPVLIERNPASAAQLRDTLDARLRILLGRKSHANNPVAAAMQYGALAPGKRIRPLLMLMTARALGADEAGLTDLACTLEMVHAASLFLDDLPCMDDANCRRGQATVHVVYGEDVATLSAVALLATAWRIAASTPNVEPAVRLEIVKVLSNAIGLDGLVGGQYGDLHEDRLASIESAEVINHQKTAVLFEAAFEIGCLVAGAGMHTREHLKTAAAHLGQAFQLADDLGDVELSPSEIGKDTHQDAGKPNLVALLGVAAVKQKLRAHVLRAHESLSLAMPLDRSVIELTNSLFLKNGMS